MQAPRLRRGLWRGPRRIDLPAGLAAVAAEHGCEIVTLDRDFARFESVRHRRPLAA